MVGGKCDPVLGGTFYQPSVLTGIQSNMVISQEEIFGPVAPIIKCVVTRFPCNVLMYMSTRFEEEEEAISIANATQHGLCSESQCTLFTIDFGVVQTA